MKNLVLALALFVGLAPIAFAAGPTIEPGPETPLAISAELLQILSNAKVAGHMHTASARHGAQLRQITRRLLTPELGEYTFKYSNNQRPPTYVNFTVRAGGGFSGIFMVVSVSDMSVAEPVIEPMPSLRP